MYMARHRSAGMRALAGACGIGVLLICVHLRTHACVRRLCAMFRQMEEQSRLGTMAIPGAAAKLRSRMLRAQHQQQQRMTNIAGFLPGALQPIPATMLAAPPLGTAGPRRAGPLHMQALGPPSGGGHFVVQSAVQGGQYTLQSVGQASGGGAPFTLAQGLQPSTGGAYTVQAVQGSGPAYAVQGGTAFAMQGMQGAGPAYAVTGGTPYAVQLSPQAQMQVADARVW